MRRRVVVSGIGVVSSLGPDLASTCAAIEAGRSAVRPTCPDSAVAVAPRTAEVLDFEARPHFRLAKALKLTNRPTQFAVAAASMALDASGWPIDPDAMRDVGVVIGSSGFDPRAADLTRAVGYDPDGRTLSDLPYFAERMLSSLNPLWLLIGLPNMTSSHVAIQLRAHGPNSSIMNDSVAGVQSLGEATDWIRNGEAVAVLAGGADSAIYPHACASYAQAGLLATTSAGPPAFVPGEGGAILLLEEREHAVARGAAIHGEICGYGSASASAVAPGALDLTMSAALADAAWAPTMIGVVGSSLLPVRRAADLERAALARVLGPGATEIQRVEYQAQLGHALAAAGAIDMAVLLALHARTEPRGILFNTMGFSGQAVTLALVGPQTARHEERR